MAYKKIIFCLFAFSLTASANTTYTTIEDETTISILTPTLQERKTAKLKLANGVEVYLVSDPGVDVSAAAACMESGSWQDPKEYPGTAHFLEHMLFMGSEAYPKEFEYSQYIKDGGGNVNAFTASDRTVYMFSVQTDFYKGALDRFSHFFIDPLFNPSCIQRELHAVDQEHSKNVENDFWRQYMVFKETSPEGHPNTKFSTGNAQTLSGIPQETLKSWFQTHYRPNKLHLVMLSSLPLEEMTTLAVSSFGLIPENNENTVFEELPKTMLSSKQKGHFIYIEPIKDLRLLSLVFELPQSFASIQEKWTAELISYALTESSAKSLLQELKHEHIAESIQSGIERYGKGEVLFRIDIKLTEGGVSQIDTAILRCFQTLARLKQSGIPFSIFQEMQTLRRINYQYQSRQDPFEWITEIAANMPDENLSTFPEKTEIPETFNPESLLQFVSALTPESAVYFILADPVTLGIQMNSKEKWMDVPYTVEAVPPAKLTVWQHAAPFGEMGIPPSNPFLPSNLELISSEISKEIPTPIKLIEEDKAVIYFAQDSLYKTPETSFLFSIKTPSLDGSARSLVLADLLSETLDDNLLSPLFLAKTAGINAFFTAKGLSFSVAITGYSEKTPDLTKLFFSALQNVSCDEAHFALYKASLLSSYGNSSLELPVKQAMNTLSNVLLNDAPTPNEKFEALKNLSFEDFNSFYRQWLSSIYIEGSLYGNLSKETANDLTNSILSSFSSSLPYKNPKKQEILLLPEKRGPFKITQKTERQGNGTVLAIELGSFSFAKRANQQILSTALQDAFFDTLRTKQQTGYIAQSWASEIENQLLQTFVVQSSSHSPEDLLNRFELFLEDFNKRLGEIIPSERFESLKASQITSLEVPPENLYGMASYLNTLAFTRKGDFNWKEKQIEALKNLTYEEFLKESHEMLSTSNGKRLAILVEGVSLSPPFIYTNMKKEEMVQIGTFVSDNP